jgi:hypothetical protein
MQYNEAQRKQMAADIKGKTVERLEWEGKYWVLVFTDGYEMCFNRFMSEMESES